MGYSFQKAQLAALEAKIKENRRIREEKEKQDALEQERSRRTQGKEIVELRQKFKVSSASCRFSWYSFRATLPVRVTFLRMCREAIEEEIFAKLKSCLAG